MPTDDEYERRPESFPPAVRHLREAAPGLSPFLATTLLLLAEQAASAEQAEAPSAASAASTASASPCPSCPPRSWAPYLATLPPRCPDCLLLWSAEEKRELEGTALEEVGPESGADVFRRHVAPLAAARPDLWPNLLVAASSGGGAPGNGVASEPPAGLCAFLDAASLVGSRAFHLEAENWVSGAKQVAQLSGGGTQVYLLPGIDMINHCHDPARRNARLERVSLAQAQAAAAELPVAQPLPPPPPPAAAGGAAAEGGAGGDAAAAAPSADAYFVMWADKPIRAGQEVLHTYGDLSDAQLLQTYGFLDSEDDFRTSAGTAATVEGGGSGGYRNPYNAALVPWAAVEGVCNGLLKSMAQAPPAAAKRAKREFLAAAGVLQAAAPADTTFVLLAREPLPPQLLTAVQVLLMTGEEFQELVREWGAGAAAAGGGGGGAASGGGGARAKVRARAQAAAASAAAPSLPHLTLGTSLLEEDDDFAEMVCIACLQILESCLERYPSSAKDDVRALRGGSGGCEGRRRMALRVRLGERDVLQCAKKAVVELLRRLREGEGPGGGDGGGNEGEGGAGGSTGGDGDSSSGGSGSSAGGENEEAAAGESTCKRAAAPGGPAEAAVGQPAAKRRRSGLGSAPPEGADADGDADGCIGDADEALMLASDDSDKVGYGAVEYDDGMGEAHDRAGVHGLPPGDD